MKKIILLIGILAVLTSAYSSFCEGYQAGYEEGYCYGNYFCIPPIPPICPMPRIGEDNYGDGYNRGFIDGLRRRP